jgi:hypothetical protein
MPKAPLPDCYERKREEFAPAWRTEAPVLCLAGKGPLDEAASAMLAQLLGKHGLGARIAPYEAASREAVASLNVSGITIVCTSYLDIRHPVAPALPDPAAKATVCSNSRGPLADRGPSAEGDKGARHRRRRLLLDVPARGGELLPRGGAQG